MEDLRTVYLTHRDAGKDALDLARETWPVGGGEYLALGWPGRPADPPAAADVIRAVGRVAAHRDGPILTVWLCRAARVVPGTQAAAVAASGLDPVSAGAKVVDGAVFKPDARPDRQGRCSVCRRPGVWISGAGAYLCARHQDDY